MARRAKRFAMLKGLAVASAAAQKKADDVMNVIRGAILALMGPDEHRSPFLVALEEVGIADSLVEFIQDLGLTGAGALQIIRVNMSSPWKIPLQLASYIGSEFRELRDDVNDIKAGD